MQYVDLSPLREWIQRSDQGLETTLSFSVDFNGNDYQLWLVQQPDDVIEVTVLFPRALPISAHAAEALFDDINKEIHSVVHFIFHAKSCRVSGIVQMDSDDLEMNMAHFILLCDCLILIFDHVIETSKWGASLIELAFVLREEDAPVH